MRCSSLLLAGLLGLSASQAAVRLPNLIGDHMVMQRNARVSIWGWADDGEQVTVTFQNQRKTSAAGTDGRWQVFLDPMLAGGPYEMRIAGKNSITLSDVMVGEVWICSGQSNMWWPVRLSADPKNEIAKANHPPIRLFTVEQIVSEKVLDNVNGTWTATTPESVAEFSAVAYYFGREIHKRFNTPVGLIDSSWGATTVEAWTSRSALEADLALQPVLWRWKKTLAEYPYAMERYQKQLEEWEKQSAAAKAEGKTEPRRPFPPLGSGHFGTNQAGPNAQNQWTPGGLFNSMIAPLTSFSIRGAIWYQGETNAEPGRALEYGRLFTTMISDWRRAWGQGAFPFFFAQLANFERQGSLGLFPQPNPQVSTWAEVREGQAMALALPNTGMVVTLDIGDATDIHPKNKQEVGRRLSLLARSLVYGETLVASGPIYRGLIVEGDRIRVRFDHVGGGLVGAEGGIKGFVIAGREHKWVGAEARIEGHGVVVWSTQVPGPVAVRYAWADNPEATLFNKEGLPASPFRTDDWSQ